MTLFGFPGDADNQLTDNSSLGVSVTNGTISAIRESAGTRSKLYQSDADASHGNSGGPAVDRDGRAFGILTYRYSSGNQADATKSYIRDIADFTELVSANNVELNTTSSTQDAWEQGLTAYSNQYYSKALEQFNYVQKQFPAHRLVATYIDYSEQAIREGKDVREPSAALFVLGVGAGLGGLLVAILLTTRHYGHHRAYYEHTKHKLRPHHG